MKVRYFLLVAVALVLLTGCHRDASALLERAEAYLPSQPDSAEVSNVWKTDFSMFKA